jgi:hypothetical protein
VVLNVDDQAALDTRLAVRFLEPVPWVAEGFDQANPVEASDILADVTPTGVLTDRHIENYYERIPGDARWWNGDADLSATLWAFRDDDTLHLVASVSDQDRRADDTAVDRQDRVAVALADASGANPLQFTIVGTDRPIIVGGPPGVSSKVERDTDRGTTRYRIALPLSALPGGGANAVRMNLRVYDRDADTLKQHAQWAPGFDGPATPQVWRLLRLGH